MSVETTHASWAREDLDKKISDVVNGLNNLADDIDRKSNREGGAERIIHLVHWGLANLNLDGLVRAERELADALEAERRQA